MTKMLNMLNKLNMFEHVFFWSLVKQKRKWNLKKNIILFQKVSCEKHNSDNKN